MREIFVIFVIAVFILSVDTVAAARVHGTIYEWHTLEPLENVIIYVNSTPSQRVVAKNGFYEFELNNGNYQIVVKYYKNNKLVYRCNESIVIESEGNFTLDLIMFPDIDLNESLFADEDVNFRIDQFLGKEDNGNLILLSIFLVSIVSLLILIMLWKKKESDEEISEIPDDLRETIEIIRDNGGRITQLELRKELNYSEAKISLMLADLENRGIIEKFKKGRGNVIILRK